ncbi:MAG: hypothetical protein WBB98_04820 [Xanthobacteraceae bacterium]
MTETIVAAALRVKGMTISDIPPARHHTLLWAISEIDSELRLGPESQGFTTSMGRFVDRKEALRIALDAKQIDKPKYQPHQLFSEDLW